MIDRSTIERIMQAADIVDVVGDFVALRRAGANYKGLCPFHNEKTPSFMVSPSKQICKCFSCGSGGNVVQFVMQHEQMSYPEALKWLGRRYGIEVKEKELTDEQKKVASQREAMFVLNEWAKDFFVQQLHETPKGTAVGLTYFRQRGLRDDIIRKFQLGYSPPERNVLAQTAVRKGFSQLYLEKTGLCYLHEQQKRLNDRFYDRVIFPVHTISGRVVAFGGRTLHTAKNIAKYVNSPESEIYSKKKELYGLFLAKQAIAREDRCYLVEGYLDVIAMHQNGIENVVASSGTALTPEQVRLIHRLTENVTVLYDGDAAGIKASLRGIDLLLAEGLKIKVLLLPDGEDPDSFSQKHSATEFRNYINEQQQDFILFKTRLLMGDAQHDPLKRTEAVRDVVRSIAVVPNEVARNVYLHELAVQMQIDEGIILRELVQERQRLKAETEKQKEIAVRNQAARQKQEALPAATEGNNGATIIADSLTQQGEEASPRATQGAYAAATMSSQFTPSVPLQLTSTAQRRLVAAEDSLVTFVIRYGEYPIVLEEEGTEFLTPSSQKTSLYEEEKEVIAPQKKWKAAAGTPYVAPYVKEELSNDDIVLRQAGYQQIVDEAAQAFEQGNFSSMSYFMQHPQAEISQLAMKLAHIPYQLSRMQEKIYVPEERRLDELVPRLIYDLKFAILEVEKEGILAQLRQQTGVMDQDEERLNELMKRLMEIHQIEAAFAQVLGDRVLGR